MTPDPGSLGMELIQLAGIVLVVESALATLFQWRVYRMVFDNRAMKTVVMVATGLTIVAAFGYDVFDRIMRTTASQAAFAPWSGWVSATLSALVIAGGSAGVNTLLQRLGIRSPLAAEPERPVLDERQAWLSVRVRRARSVGPVEIAIRPLPEAEAGPALAGTVVESRLGERLRSAFTGDSMRFPRHGGRTVEAGRPYEIIATAACEQPAGDAAERRTVTRTVYRGSFASRAVVDFEIEM